jgi:hypothetical protein
MNEERRKKKELEEIKFGRNRNNSRKERKITKRKKV